MYEIDGNSLNECQSFEELEQMGIPKIAARTLFRRILLWKENGINKELVNL